MSGRPRTAPDHVCEHCGRVFRPMFGGKGKPIRYCGLACYWAALAAARTRICPQCGQAFSRAGTQRKYCSRACFALACHRQEPRQIYACETCGRAFAARAKDGSRPRRFCSAACNTVAQRRPKSVWCVRCRKLIPKPVHLLRSPNESGALCRFPRYCSDECRYGAGRRRRAGAALLRVLKAFLRRRLTAERRAARDSRWSLGAFCLLTCPNCGGRMPRGPDAYRRRWCSRRCIKQMRRRYLLWTGLSGQAQYEMLLTLGLMKNANRLVEDRQKGTQYGRSGEDANLP
jgi:hypothetical protein